MDVLIPVLVVLVATVLYIAGLAVAEMTQRHRHRRASRTSTQENSK